MKQGGLQLLRWSPLLLPPPNPSSSLISTRQPPASLRIKGSAEVDTSAAGELTARERRQLRSERRVNRASESGNWREAVEERLLHKPKKKPRASWTEDLNLDLLARLGPRWWVLRVSRVTGQETAERLARALARNFPDLQFKVYMPAIQEKRRLKNGSYTIKQKPFFPGCVFLHCILNKDIHDFIKEFDGIGGFLGSKVGNIKRQINRPKPVPDEEIEEVFRQAKEEQEKSDQAFEEEEQEENVDSFSDARTSVKATADNKPRRRSKKNGKPSGGSQITGDDYKSLTPGVTVRVLSGPFAEFTGCLKELDHKDRKATVGFVLFGKESFVELKVDQIVAETK